MSGFDKPLILCVPSKNSFPTLWMPCAGSGVVRIDPLHFLAGCRKRQLNQSIVYICMLYTVLLFIRAPFYLLLVFICMCSVFKLFWLSRHYLPGNWLERIL